MSSSIPGEDAWEVNLSLGIDARKVHFLASHLDLGSSGGVVVSANKLNSDEASVELTVLANDATVPHSEVNIIRVVQSERACGITGTMLGGF